MLPTSNLATAYRMDRAITVVVGLTVTWATMHVTSAQLPSTRSIRAQSASPYKASPYSGSGSGTVTLARPSLEPSNAFSADRDVQGLSSSTGIGVDTDTRPGDQPSAQRDIDRQRARLFNELAEEFSAFDRLGNLVRRVSQLVKPSVIHIEAHKTENKNGRVESYDEAGSGVVIASGGDAWVLTNRHVIAGASPNEILLRTSDGREMTPIRVLSDPSTDVAVMKIAIGDLPKARLGNSDEVQIGDFVIAIGSPFGLSHSVTFGIMSAKGRRDLSLGDQQIELQDFFQTDAAINPGNSGGPLLNLRGEVIAVNTAIASSSGGSEGIGFAIPINMATSVADQLIRYGQLRRGYLGVTLDPEFSTADLVARGITNLTGALVKSVRPGSPAATANLQQGDIIVGFNGSKIDNDDHLVARVGLTEIGKSVPMIIYRDGKRYRTSVVLTDLN